MSRGKKTDPGKAKPPPDSGAQSVTSLEELLGSDEEEPTRHVQFEVPPGVKPLVVEDLTGESGPLAPKASPPANVESIFENLEIGQEDSLEMPVHELTPPKSQEPPAAQKAKVPTPVPASKFARGFTAGRMPLDGSEFLEEKKLAKKKTPIASTMPPASVPPMDENLRVRKSGFLRSITFRVIVLLLLVLVLAAALYLAWYLFDAYNTRQEMQRLELQRQELEQKKSSVYKEKLKK